LIDYNGIKTSRYTGRSREIHDVNKLSYNLSYIFV